jgi:hypothetical protein
MASGQPLLPSGRSRGAARYFRLFEGCSSSQERERQQCYCCHPATQAEAGRHKLADKIPGGHQYPGKSAELAHAIHENEWQVVGRCAFFRAIAFRNLLDRRALRKDYSCFLISFVALNPISS